MPQTKESIRILLATNDRAVARAMVVLFDRQTSDEKATEATRHHNNRGFNHGDAKKGTYFARWVLSGRELTGHHLERARRMAMRYAGQLVEEADAKERASRT